MTHFEDMAFYFKEAVRLCKVAEVETNKAYELCCEAVDRLQDAHRNLNEMKDAPDSPMYGFPINVN